MAETVLMAKMDCKDRRDHKVQPDQLDHLDRLVLKDRKESEAEMVRLERMVLQEIEVPKENLAHQATQGYLVPQVKEEKEV